MNEYKLPLTAVEVEDALKKACNLPNPLVAVSVTEATDGTVTMVNTYEDGKTETFVVSPDASGNPVKLTVNGTEVPITWTEATA
jgi:hypothetical protein